MSSHESHQHPESASERDYADKDIPIPFILKSGLYIAIFTALTFWGVRYWFDKLAAGYQAENASIPAIAAERVLPPSPQLQIAESRDWAAESARQQQSISGYAWANRDAGAVRIPVERAMELAVERGLPAREKAGP